MPKFFKVPFRTVTYGYVIVEADTPEDARDEAEQEGIQAMGGCCSGWGRAYWGKEEGEWLIDDEEPIKEVEDPA